MLLNFFIARLKPAERGAKPNTEVYLRYRATADAEDLTGNEPVLASFCFPLGPESITPKEFMSAEEYTFTLTYGDGRRFTGFCRRFLPAAPRVGSRQRLPQVMCIVSEYSWNSFFFKVLQVAEQLVRSSDGLLDSGAKDLLQSSLPGTFLHNLGQQLSPEPVPGQVIQVALPVDASVLSVSPPKKLLSSASQETLLWTDDTIELQVPPDCGNGKWNCGVSLARLLWHVPVAAMLTLVSSILLERRIILVGQSKDTITAAVQAATALLYPFKWHQIYLPLLPRSFKDYLTAPMPFLIGMPAELLPVLKGIPMDEVVILDLDLGKCTPAPGSVSDDAQHLPWKDRLEAALSAAYSKLRSPTEYESTPLVASIMQEYYLKLFGHYRAFIHEHTPANIARLSTPSPATAAANGSAGSGGASNSTRTGRDGSLSNTSTSNVGAGSGRADKGGDETLKGYGHLFDQNGFVASHQRNEKARRFLSMLRHSQLWEVFIQERLQLAREDFTTQDPFEDKVAKLSERKRTRLAARLRAESAANSAKWLSLTKKQRRFELDDSGVSPAAARLELLKRIAADPATLREDGSEPPVELLCGLDPVAFFEDLDEEVEEAEAREAPDGVFRHRTASVGDLRSSAGSFTSNDNNTRGGRSYSTDTSPSAAARPLGRASATLAYLQNTFHSATTAESQPTSSQSADPGTPTHSGSTFHEHLATVLEGPSRSYSSFSAAAPPSVTTLLPSGVHLTTTATGAKTYEGSLSDLIKMSWYDLKSSVKSAKLPSSRAPEGSFSGPKVTASSASALHTASAAVPHTSVGTASNAGESALSSSSSSRSSQQQQQAAQSSRPVSGAASSNRSPRADVEYTPLLSDSSPPPPPLTGVPGMSALVSPPAGFNTEVLPHTSGQWDPFGADTAAKKLDLLSM